jgi:hypothetical protein
LSKGEKGTAGEPIRIVALGENNTVGNIRDKSTLYASADRDNSRAWKPNRSKSGWGVGFLLGCSEIDTGGVFENPTGASIELSDYNPKRQSSEIGGGL